MRTAAVAFLLSAAVAAIATPIVRRIAVHFGLLDRARDSRRVHGHPVPRLGGLAIMAGFYTPLLALLFHETSVGQIFYGRARAAVALMAAGLVIGALGVYDDLRTTNARKKLAVQVPLAVFLYFAGFRINEIALPFGLTLQLGWLAIPFTVFWVVGVINALNLIDGMDGLAGGVALFAVSSLFVMALLRGDAIMMLMMAALGGAVLGFLFYNFNPASIFMGDTGSLFLGLILASSAIHTNLKSSTTVALFIPIVLLGLPIADTLLAVGRRALRGRPVFSADKEHIHHRLLAMGFSQRKAVMVLYAACLVLGGSALLLVFADSRQAALILSTLMVVFVVAVRRLGFLRLAHASAVNDLRRRNRRLRGVVRTLRERFETTRTPQGMWDAIRPLSTMLGAQSMTLTLGLARKNGGAPASRHRFSTAEDAGTLRISGAFHARFEIADEDRDLGSLEIVWTDGRREIDRDDELALEMLCDLIAEACRGLGSQAERVRPRMRAVR